MATSGQVNTQTIDNSFFWVYWHQEGNQDITNNKTRIYWSCGVTCGHSYYANAIEMSAVYINNTLVYGGGTYSNFSRGEHRIAYGFMDIPHNNDGTKTFSISYFTGWLYSNNHYSAAESIHTLNAIPRKATLVSATDFTDLTSPTVTYSNPAGTSASTLQAYIYDTDDTTILVNGKDLPKDDTSKKLSLTSGEIDKLRNTATSGSKKVWFYIKTVIGGVTYWSSKIEKTFSVEENDNSRPEVTMTAELDNGHLSSTFDGLYIQGKSRVNIKLSAQGKYGAEIKSYSADINGKTYNSAEFSTDVLVNAGDVKIIGYAKDSRGFTGSAEQTVNVIPYAKPMVVPLSGENAILCYRCDSNGNKTGKGTRVYLKAKMVSSKVESGGHQYNFCTLQMRMKAAGDNWSDDWVDLMYDDESETGEYIGLLSGNEAQLTKAYTIQLRAIDNFLEHDIKTLDIPTEDVALHLGRGGKNVSVGTYCTYDEDYTFYSEWKAIFDKEVVIGGKVVKNHVVEEGTDGIWHYRKWADGTAECWGTYINEAANVTTTWGSLYESNGYTVPLPEHLFLEAPQLSVTPASKSAVMITLYGDGSATTTPNIAAIRPDRAENIVLKFSIYAHGRWAEEE